MLGCHRGDRFRAIAPVAPGGTSTTLPLATSACAGEVAIWEGVGTEDIDHLAGAALVRDYYRTANGCAATKKATTPAGCEAYESCRTEVPSVYCTYPGGHSWPSIGTSAVWSFVSKF
jgi:poly(3-hydroxybutyrate) depolymerase